MRLGPRCPITNTQYQAPCLQLAVIPPVTFRVKLESRRASDGNPIDHLLQVRYVKVLVVVLVTTYLRLGIPLLGIAFAPYVSAETAAGELSLWVLARAGVVISVCPLLSFSSGLGGIVPLRRYRTPPPSAGSTICLF